MKKKKKNLDVSILSRVRKMIKKKIFLDLFRFFSLSSSPVSHASSLPSSIILPLFLSFHLSTISFPLFPSLSELSLSVSPLRTKEGGTGADNDLMYGPVMSLVGGQTPLFPLATRNRLHGSIGLSTKESRKHEIFFPERRFSAQFGILPSCSIYNLHVHVI